MIYSKKLQHAIDFAIKVHQGQFRKGKTVPYIVHPLAVGLILAKAEAHENVVIAGITHDTIEDCVPYRTITRETIEKKFGEAVAKMVNDVTEQDKTLSWDERKKQALDHISQMNQGSLLVKSADQLHNMNDLITDYKREGDKMFANFNATKKLQLERYQKLIPAIEEVWEENPLLPDLKIALKKLVMLWS